MRRRDFLTATLAMAAAPTVAQPREASSRPVVIGWVSGQPASSQETYLTVLREALAQHGYVEGRNLRMELRFGDNDPDRVPGLVAELERIPVDVLLAQGTATPIVFRLAPRVPVLWLFSGDPVVAGLADSLARPRGNMSGLTFMAAELNGKRIEILREVKPGTRRVALLGNPLHPGYELERDNADAMAKRRGMKVDYYPVPSVAALDAAFARMRASPPDGVSVFGDGFALQHSSAIIGFASRLGAPVVSAWPAFAKAGAVCTYGPRISDSYRRLADYVDRVLRGTPPATLPIEQPTRFELVVNASAAKALRLALPQSLLLRADEVLGA